MAPTRPLRDEAEEVGDSAANIVERSLEAVKHSAVLPKMRW